MLRNAIAESDNVASDESDGVSMYLGPGKTLLRQSKDNEAEAEAFEVFQLELSKWV